MPKQAGVTHSQIFFYVPNLMDYGRYILVFTSMYLAFDKDQWLPSILCYFFAIIVDAIDGIVARALDQTSRYGSCLDMVCDRAQVSMIYIVFGRVWPKLEYILYAFFIIDYGAHYL